eukprot:jgi/Tetstr1/443387/TSEL_031402.t1
MFDEENEDDDEAECVSDDPYVATEQAKDARAACMRHADAARLSAEAAHASAATANERAAQRAESAPASSHAPPVAPAADPVTLPMALDPRALTCQAARLVGHWEAEGANDAVDMFKGTGRGCWGAAAHFSQAPQPPPQPKRPALKHWISIVTEMANWSMSRTHDMGLDPNDIK